MADNNNRKKTNKKKHGGFTLLELLIAMFIFTLIIILVVGIFGRIFIYNNKIRDIEVNIEEVGTAFELMAKTMRMSSYLKASSNTQIVMYNNSTDKCMSYWFQNGELQRSSMPASGDPNSCRTASYTNYVVLAKNIDSLRFSVRTTDPDSVPPRIGRSTVTATVGGEHIQSTVSFRDYQGIVQ